MLGKRLNESLDTLYRRAVTVLASDGFFYGILAIVVLQALWYAFSFRPSIFDEQRHISNIIIYSHHWTPFLGKQKPAWDHLGEITRDGDFMFYYIMSWFLRLIRLFTHNQAAQIIGLRLICTAFFTSGVVLFRKALFEFSKLPRSVVHLLFLFFVITPSAALLPGAVNYDNLVFLLFTLLLLLSIRAVKSEKVSFLGLANILMVGLLMSVVKWASIALFAPIALYLCYDLYKKHGFDTFSLLQKSAKKVPGHRLLLTIAALAILTGLFIARPVMNTIEYGRPDPTCQAVIGPERCLQFPDYVAYANADAHKPPNFSTDDPVQYFFVFWEPRMASTLGDLLERGPSSELSVARALYDLFAFVGIILLLLYLREFTKNNYYRFLFIVTTIYLLSLFADEYLAYVAHGAPAAIRARYLLPVLPILMYFMALAAINLFGKYKKSLFVFACITLLLFTQGGSIVTYSLTTPESLYWQNSKTRAANNDLQRLLHPLVLEGNPFSKL
jgi:hypothetical protein